MSVKLHLFAVVLYDVRKHAANDPSAITVEFLWAEDDEHAREQGNEFIAGNADVSIVGVRMVPDDHTPTVVLGAVQEPGRGGGASLDTSREPRIQVVIRAQQIDGTQTGYETVYSHVVDVDLDSIDDFDAEDVVDHIVLALAKLREASN